jgi:hypothetical protein
MGSQLAPFRSFLQVAALMSGKIINYCAIAREVGSQVPTIHTYFEIREDTLMGSFSSSFSPIRTKEAAT